MSKNRDVRLGKPHKKTRLARGVELETRRTIGFARTPVEEADVKPVIYGLPLRQDTDL